VVVPWHVPTNTRKGSRSVTEVVVEGLSCLYYRFAIHMDDGSSGVLTNAVLLYEVPAGEDVAADLFLYFTDIHIPGEKRLHKRFHGLVGAYAHYGDHYPDTSLYAWFPVLKSGEIDQRVVL
jgi:hypothetical protein